MNTLSLNQIALKFLHIIPTTPYDASNGNHYVGVRNGQNVCWGRISFEKWETLVGHVKTFFENVLSGARWPPFSEMPDVPPDFRTRNPRPPNQFFPTTCLNFPTGSSLTAIFFRVGHDPNSLSSYPRGREKKCPKKRPWKPGKCLDEAWKMPRKKKC